MTIRILIADDHLMVRQGFRAMLERDGFAVVAEAGDGREAVQLAQEHRPDVAILDLVMPLLNGIDAGRQILRISPATRPILLTMFCERHHVLAALRAGITGYLLKSHAVGDLEAAIREVCQGGVYLGFLQARGTGGHGLGRPVRLARARGGRRDVRAPRGRPAGARRSRRDDSRPVAPQRLGRGSRGRAERRRARRQGAVARPRGPVDRSGDGVPGSRGSHRGPCGPRGRRDPRRTARAHGARAPARGRHPVRARAPSGSAVRSRAPRSARLRRHGPRLRPLRAGEPAVLRLAVGVEAPRLVPGHQGPVPGPSGTPPAIERREAGAMSASGAAGLACPVPRAESEFFSAYEWCLDPRLTVEDLFVRLEEELARVRLLTEPWQREESLGNIYLFVCAIACTVDDDLARRPTYLAAVRERARRFAPAVHLVQFLVNAPGAVIGRVGAKRLERFSSRWARCVDAAC